VKPGEKKVSIWGTRRKEEGEAGEGRGCGEKRKSASSAESVRMERWHEREAGWDEINKGKDSPGRVQDKDGVSPSRPAGNDRRSGIRRASGSGCRKRDPRAPARNEYSIPAGVRTAFPQRTNVDGAVCARAQQDGDGVVSVCAPVLVFS
jgi:hypothetical protein